MPFATITRLMGLNMVKLIAAGVLAVVLLIAGLILWPFASISPGSVGVMTTWGKPSDVVYQPGKLYLVTPMIQSMHEVYMGTWKATSDVKSTSKDLQVVDMKVALNYNVLPTAAAKVYFTLGNDPWKLVMDPAIHDVVKAVSARYEASELIQKRDQVGEEIRGALMTRFKDIGVNVSAVNMVDLDFSKQFNDAIEAKITAQQNALRVENEIQSTKWQAQKAVVESEAQLRVAENHAKANKVLGDSLTANPALIEKLKIEKWDGHYPQYMLGGSVPMIQLSK